MLLPPYVIQTPGLDSNKDSESSVYDFMDTGPAHKWVCANNTDPSTSREWYPWPDRIVGTSLLCVWFISNFDFQSVDQQHRASLDTNTMLIVWHRYLRRGVFPFLIHFHCWPFSQEMCNPKVRPFIHFYPEDAGPNLSEAHQGSCWLEELRSEETTTMV